MLTLPLRSVNMGIDTGRRLAANIPGPTYGNWSFTRSWLPPKVPRAADKAPRMRGDLAPMQSIDAQLAIKGSR